MQGCRQLRGEAPQGALRGVKWQRSGSRRTLSERRRAVRPAACVIRPQRGAGRFKAVRLTPSGASWCAVAGGRPPRCSSQRPRQQFAAQHEGRGCGPGRSHVAAEASRFLEDGISRQRNTRRCPPKYWLNCGFQADCATHVLNMSENCEPFVLCGCAELNDPPQRCWIGFQVDRSILR
ncbi:hypothetical protein TcYC6_0039470 [Trypanosoma cruzi]|nr:hypothetical protein TcYC6_0039470 [Trypanosoma cruzi]